MATTVQVTGLKDTQDLLKRLSSTIGRRVLLASLRKGATPIVKSIRRNTPVDTGNLKRSVGKKAARKRNNTSAAMVIGFRTSGSNKGQHGHIIEKGHKTRSGGTVKGRHILLRAYHTEAVNAITLTKNELGPQILKQIEKMAKR